MDDLLACPDDAFDPDLPYAEWGPDEKLEFARLCRIAARLALDADAAPARCADRACRRKGRCRVRVEGSRLVCSAGAIPPEVTRQIVLMTAFLTELGKADD